MYELALFAGAGGGILGGMLRGHTIVGAVEIEEHPREVLKQRQRDGILDEFPIWDDVTTFRADNPDTADYINGLREIRDQLVISGGFPCQDISSAGKGAGIGEGTRSGLWFEMARIISEIRPRNVFVENSPLLVSRGFDRVLSGFAEMGYDARWGVIGANAAGACHARKRIWIIANSKRHGSQRWHRQAEKRQRQATPGSVPALVENKNRHPFTESEFYGVAYGFSDRVDRIEAIGNAQVPAVVDLAWEILDRGND